MAWAAVTEGDEETRVSEGRGGVMTCVMTVTSPPSGIDSAAGSCIETFGAADSSRRRCSLRVATSSCNVSCRARRTPACRAGALVKRSLHMGLFVLHVGLFS